MSDISKKGEKDMAEGRKEDEVIEIIEIIEIEIYAKNGREVPREAKHFKIRVDRETYEVAVHHMTGREILNLALKVPPENFVLTEIMKGGAHRQIGLDEVVDFRKHHLEKFKTIRRDHTEGLAVRRHFEMTVEDREYLDSLGLPWEAIVESNVQWVIIHDFAVPEAYTMNKVAVAVRMEPGYPVAQLDMAYFFPALVLRSGEQIKAADSPQALDEKSWQRWSRHRSATNPWRPGVDNLGTHLEETKVWIAREVKP